MRSLKEEKAQVEELLDRRDLARILKCSERTIINYEERGLLKPTRIAGLVRYSPQHVREFIERQSAER